MKWMIMATNPKPLPVKDYEFSRKDRLFLDTNIWLYLYGPQKPKARVVGAYSRMLKRILAAGSRVYIDVLVVSEFINTSARLKWQLATKKGIHFKAFRNAPSFKSVAKSISSDAARVMTHCLRIESGFADMEVTELLNKIVAGKCDFNDQVIIRLCKTEKLTLITHDADFGGAGIPILTANHRLLN